jgi:hypothetical protein
LPAFQPPNFSCANRGAACAAGIRFGAGSVPVKDRYQHNRRRKRKISGCGVENKNAASESVLRRVEDFDESFLQSVFDAARYQNFGGSAGGV